jgi:hypothetical protein
MQQLTRGQKGSEMLSLLSRRRARIERIDAEAEALIRDFCDEAYSEALRREQEASSDDIAKDWHRVAIAVAHKMGKRVGVEPLTRIAMNALFVPDRKPAAARLPRAFSKPRPLDQRNRILSPRPQLFRIQFVGATPDRETTILKEVQIRVADTSAAIVAAANTQWPPGTIGLRILDREGREVFARQKEKQR